MEATHRPTEDQRPREDWFDDDYIEFWLKREGDRVAERQRQFAMMRAVVPKSPDETFRYINLGAGPGNLDEVLLAHYPGAEAVLVDGSMAMLAEARKRLERFEGRVEFVLANLATPDWVGAVEGPFDLAVSTIALHNLRDPRRIRDLYGEIYGVLGHGSVFLNLDYVRLARPSLRALAAKASQDPEAAFQGGHGGGNPPGSVEEQLGWIREAGFAVADCFWKEFSVALFGGVHDHLHLADGEHDHGAHGEHGHGEHADHGEHAAHGEHEAHGDHGSRGEHAAPAHDGGHGHGAQSGH